MAKPKVNKNIKYEYLLSKGKVLTVVNTNGKLTGGIDGVNLTQNDLQGIYEALKEVLNKPEDKVVVVNNSTHLAPPVGPVHREPPKRPPAPVPMIK